MKNVKDNLDVLIGFNANGCEAMIHTTNPFVMKRLNDLVVEMPDMCTRLCKTRGEGVYVLPKSLLGIKVPERDYEAELDELRKEAMGAMRRIGLCEKNANGHLSSRLDFLSDGEF